MKYLLDTNVCIHYLNRTNAGISRRISLHGRRNVGVCPIIIEELFFGAFHSERVEHNLARVRRFSKTFTIWPLDINACRESGRIRAFLKPIGKSIGPFDNLIAGAALALNATLVTNNINEFNRIPGLALEDWQAGGMP